MTQTTESPTDAFDDAIVAPGELTRVAELLEHIAASLSAHLSVPGEDPRLDARAPRLTVTDAEHVDTELDLAEALVHSLWTACRDHAIRIALYRGRLEDHRTAGSAPLPS